MDQVACPRCMAVAPSGTPRCLVCSTSLENGVPVAPQAVPIKEPGWGVVTEAGLALGLVDSLDDRSREPVPEVSVPAAAEDSPAVAADLPSEPVTVPTQALLPIEAFAPPPPGSPGIPLRWTPTPVPEPAPATWAAPPAPALAWLPPAAAPVAPPPATTPAAAATPHRVQQGGQGWNIRVREEVHHLAHPLRAPAQMTAMAGAGAMPMYGTTAAPAPWSAAQPLPPAPWERQGATGRNGSGGKSGKSGWMAGLGALVLARIIGITVAAAVGVVAFGHHNWLSNLAHGGSHDVTTPAYVGAAPKLLSGPLSTTAADITHRASGMQGVNNAVASYYGAADTVPDYYLFIVAGDTANLTKNDVINQLRTSGLAVDVGPTTSKTVNGVDYACSSYTLTVSNTSVAGRLCVWVTYNDAGALASYRDMDPDQMLSITDAARTAANA